MFVETRFMLLNPLLLYSRLTDSLLFRSDNRVIVCSGFRPEIALDNVQLATSICQILLCRAELLDTTGLEKKTVPGY